MLKNTAIAMLALVAACSTAEPAPQGKLRHETYVALGNKNENKARFDLEVADTDKARLAGLMDRRELPDGTGMLFVFDHADYWSMWMKRTYVPLDMIFMNENRVITAIAENRKPLSEDFITPCSIEYEKRAVAMDGREWDIDAFFEACGANFTKRENSTKYVIELPAGTARKSGVKVGDKVVPMPAPAAAVPKLPAKKG